MIRLNIDSHIRSSYPPLILHCGNKFESCPNFFYLCRPRPTVEGEERI